MRITRLLRLGRSVRPSCSDTELQRPCADCPHSLRRHQAPEGMCLDCGCYGWAPVKAALSAA